MRPLALALFAALALVPLSAQAQSAQNMSTQRVSLAPGTFSSEVYGSVLRGQTHRYLFNVRAGQTLFANIADATGAGVYVQVYAPGRAITARYALMREDGQRYDLDYWAGRVSRSGDYQIVVWTPGNAADYAIVIGAE